MNGTQLRVGLGHDTHRLAPNRPLILGAGLGDIGDAFPDTEPAYAGIDSAVLLSRALERVTDAGWRVVNLDCTVFAQRPKLAPYKPAMRLRLAELLGVSAEAINVKAKTGEHVGPIGREEAMSADAVVLLEKVGEES